MQPSQLDIIVPCYDPQPGWEEKIIQAFTEISNALPGVVCQIILVNDGSKKLDAGSIEKLKITLPSIRYISYAENSGKGYALREGVKNSLAEFIIYTDIDFPYTINSIVSVWSVLKNDEADIAAGIADPTYYKRVPAGRRIISRGLMFLTKNLLSLKIADTQRGLKGFNQKGKTVFLRTTINRYLFDLEFIWLASKKTSKIKILPVQVQLRENIVFSRMNPGILFQEGLNFMKLFFRSIFGAA